MSDENKQLENEFEKCVVCGKQTEYLRSTPINLRKCYVVGVGQVCQACYNELKKSEIKFVDSEDD